ncbi:hypothetical protein [Hymenobacter jejuensis]|uniref:Uncharacterized protein n=1 Tax=Hymenobacter jejuensis TaxID=2502781 RepID=A0A5B7ZUX1_9BACT|nr:hypothetical protein [Hymenobacter jejuensis]QDA58921.1 hypothetical protein FHG12_01855 [Hymenobacter jejuensis]
MADLSTLETRQVPAKEWVAVVTAFTASLGTPPTLLPQGSSLEDATDAIWGTDDSGLHLVKVAEGQEPLFKDSTDPVISVASADKVKKFVADLTSSGHLELKAYVQAKEFNIATGESRTVTVGIVYLFKNPKDFSQSETLGVIHNPPFAQSKTY